MRLAPPGTPPTQGAGGQAGGSPAVRRRKGQHPNPETGADQASPDQDPKTPLAATAQRGYWQAKPQQTQSFPLATQRDSSQLPGGAVQEWEQDG